MGDNDKKINVFYPANNKRFEDFFNFIKSYYTKEFKIINLIGISENQRFLDINSTHYFSSFKTGHTYDSLGYTLNSIRRKLKHEHAGKTGAEIVSFKRDFPDINIYQEYNSKLFSYAVDANNVESENIRNSKVLFIDSTFLRKEDREDNTHYTIDEAYGLAKKSNCENVVFMHLSKRYGWSEFATHIQDNTNYKKDFKSIFILNTNKPYSLTF